MTPQMTLPRSILADLTPQVTPSRPTLADMTPQMTLPRATLADLTPQVTPSRPTLADMTPQVTASQETVDSIDRSTLVYKKIQNTLRQCKRLRFRHCAQARFATISSQLRSAPLAGTRYLARDCALCWHCHGIALAWPWHFCHGIARPGCGKYLKTRLRPAPLAVWIYLSPNCVLRGLAPTI